VIAVKLPWEKLEKIKRPYKFAIFFGTVVVFLAVGFFLIYQPKQQEIQSTLDDISSLETKITQHRKKARELPKIKERLRVVKLQFEFAKQFLPQKKEVPQLLRAISDNGAQSGLNVTLFQPNPKDQLQDFYAEIGFQMKVEGPYPNIANFLYKIGRMDRIVNIDDIRIGSPQKIEGDTILAANCNGKTFRFLTEQEQKQIEEAKKAAGKKARPKQKTQ
jgi:type IV pilus assembly protein PilO